MKAMRQIHKALPNCPKNEATENWGEGGGGRLKTEHPDNGLSVAERNNTWILEPRSINPAALKFVSLWFWAKWKKIFEGPFTKFFGEGRSLWRNTILEKYGR